MTQNGFKVDPIVSYPHQVIANQTYMVSVDFAGVSEPENWPFADEEYPIYCLLEAGSQVQVQSLSAQPPAVVLHRFGGSYGPAQFLISARGDAANANLLLQFVSAWGAPLGGVQLEVQLVAQRELAGVGLRWTGSGESSSSTGGELNIAEGDIFTPDQPSDSTLNALGSLVLIAADGRGAGDELYPNGIDANTGQPLLRIDAAIAARLAQGQEINPAQLQSFASPKQTGKSGAFFASVLDEREQRNIYRVKQDSASGRHFGIVSGISQDRIEEARWALVLHALEDSTVLQAIWPLVQHRMMQMGFTRTDFDFREVEPVGAWLSRHTEDGKRNLANSWGEVPPVLVYQSGERTNRWLARHGVSMGPVDPRRGVPYYLLLLGRPGPLHAQDEIFIPVSFQYELDIFWGVGRLCFSDLDGQHNLSGYTTYAERLISVEQRTDAAEQLRREITFFGTRHERDVSTERNIAELIQPLSEDERLSKQINFGRQRFIAEDATRGNLEHILSGGSDGLSSALLFYTAHGLGFNSGEDRQIMQQGAIITQDWSGSEGIKREHWFAAEDLAAMGQKARLDGSIVLLYASYSLGCPGEDEAIVDSQGERLTIAPFPFIAQLPQQMLRSGALAVLGHLGRAWPRTTNRVEGVTAPHTVFADMLSRLIDGMRLGSATDQMNLIQAAAAVTLTNELEDLKFGKEVDPYYLADLWVDLMNARNYSVLGDPAVKLPW